MCYVVMLKGLGKTVTSERVFMDYDQAKRYAKHCNEDLIEAERGYFYVEKCMLQH
jgi:hypothetical protein